MGVTLAARVRQQGTLMRAWRSVRANAVSSLSIESRNEARTFEANLLANIRAIQGKLQRGTFAFQPQRGIPQKREGKAPRPLVRAVIRDRVVQRAVLDVLQTVPGVRAYLDTPTSFGAIQGRSREAAILLARKTVSEGRGWFIRSDIKDFFTRVRREDVVAQLMPHLDGNDDFLDMVADATRTELGNLADLGDEARLFPDAERGVPQGCCLSPLFANIYLADFDREMNGRGVLCLRYLDDFLLLGSSERAVRGAFRSGLRLLDGIGLTAYEPDKANGKAEWGEASRGFTFLGCELHPGLVAPSRKARQRFLEKLDKVVADAKNAVRSIRQDGQPRKKAVSQYLQLLAALVQGWSKAYGFCNHADIADALDREIDERIAAIRECTRQAMAGSSRDVRRRILGVPLVRDALRPSRTRNPGTSAPAGAAATPQERAPERPAATAQWTT